MKISDKENGGPAFPTKLDNLSGKDMIDFSGDVLPHGMCQNYSGITVRDYFAVSAMQGWLSINNAVGNVRSEEHAKVAKFAYDLADAMLKERAK